MALSIKLTLLFLTLAIAILNVSAHPQKHNRKHPNHNYGEVMDNVPSASKSINLGSLNLYWWLVI